MGDDDAVACFGKQRSHIDKAMNIVRPTVQQENRRTIGRTVLGISHIEDPGIDLFQRTKCGAFRRRACRFVITGLSVSGVTHEKTRGANAQGSGLNEMTAIGIDLLRHVHPLSQADMGGWRPGKTSDLPSRPKSKWSVGSNRRDMA